MRFGSKPFDGKILVSACLLGHRVRYDGSDKACAYPALARWRAEGRLVVICKERTGGDVTQLFIDGAKAALEIAQANNCRFAVLIDGSPSCGGSFIYDGTFQGERHPAAGVTASLLRRHGIEVFSETEIDELEVRLSADHQSSVSITKPS